MAIGGPIAFKGGLMVLPLFILGILMHVITATIAYSTAGTDNRVKQALHMLHTSITPLFILFTHSMFEQTSTGSTGILYTFMPVDYVRSVTQDVIVVNTFGYAFIPRFLVGILSLISIMLTAFMASPFHEGIATLNFINYGAAIWYGIWLILFAVFGMTPAGANVDPDLVAMYMTINMAAIWLVFGGVTFSLFGSSKHLRIYPTNTGKPRSVE